MSQPRRRRSAPTRLAWLLLALQASISGEGWAETLFQAPIFKVGDGPTSIATGDFNADGRIDLAVANSQSNDISILIGHPDGTFAPQSRFPAGTTPSSIGVADLNRDGRFDLVVANASTEDVSVLLGNGDGTFDPQARFLVGDAPASLAIGDMNLDGLQDVLVANQGSDDMSILLGIGDGTFRSQARMAVGERPFKVVLTDFSGDGVLDLAVALHGDPSRSIVGGVSLFLGPMAGGVFSPAGFASLSYNFSFTFGEFNRDGAMDLALVDLGGLLRIYQGHGGSFSFVKDTGPTISPARGVVAGDFDFDGNSDLAVYSDRTGVNVAILMGKGDFTFSYPAYYTDGGSDPRDSLVGDLNGDGKQDLVEVNFATEDVTLFSGNGDGTFSVQPHVSFAGAPFSLAVADFNSDSNLDLVAIPEVLNPDHTLRPVLLLGDGHGGLTERGPIPSGNSPFRIDVGDFNRDGRSDLAVADGETQDVSILLGNGDGTFVAGGRVALGREQRGFAIDDFNGDAWQDLAIIVANYGAVAVALGHGDGTFGPPSFYSLTFDPIRIGVGDFNGDGKQDIVALSPGGFQFVSELQGFGDGTFAPQKLILLACCGGPVAAGNMVVGDLRSDGKDDVFLVESNANRLLVLSGTTDGLYFSAASFPTGDSPLAVTRGDFNADGVTDLASANCISGDVSINIIAGGPSGGYELSRQRVLAGACPQALVSADFNGDGRIDLVVGNRSSYEIAVILNVGPFPDSDHDGVPDAQDTCTDPDGDGYGSPGLPSSTCATDNCPRTSNISQSDSDGDAVGDTCDNCPNVFNPGQEDRDRDGAGDACDSCTDIDRDGFGNPGYSANTCAPDNCPFRPNANQADSDEDQVGDICDTCTDLDHDGFGSPGFLANTCFRDICPDHFNPQQEDTDRDNYGDACDPCPLDPLNDSDRDGFCADRDNCPKIANPGQEDVDGDGLGGKCDNCPNAPNPDQNDSNVDGAGDACQPTVLLSSIDQDGGPVLEVSAHAQDPDGESLSGTLDFFEVMDVTLQNPGIDGLACTIGFSLPEWRAGQGIAYLNVPEIGVAFLYDLDLLSSLAGLPACEDGQQDFSFWEGPCVVAKYAFGPVMNAARGDFCIRSTGAHSGGHDFTILQISSSSLDGTIVSGVPSLRIPFAGELPRRSDISSLKPGRKYSLSITVSDGLTPSVGAQEQFLYQGESMMVINTNPHASITAPSQVECNRQGGAQVVLDGSSSTDPDSTANSNDDIVSFEWVMNAGQPSEQLLGIGEMLTATLPLGADNIGLRVTDSQGARDMAQAVMDVRDTTPPSLVCPPGGAVECTSPEGAHVSLVTQANDLCGPVTIINSRTAGPDASGAYPLGATQITFTATDAVENVSTCGATVTVRDTTPPSFAMTTDSQVLWPPNHRMVPVHVGWQVSDRCDRSPGVSLVSVVSSESDDAPGNGDGNTTDDIADAAVGTPDSAVLLRAERSGDGSGRAYTLTYATSDASRNTASALGVVTVPHDLGTGPEPLLMNLELGGTPGMTHVYWNAVPGAEMYDLIKGDLGQVRTQNGKVWLGPVHVLAAWMTGTSYTEGSPGEIPATGKAFFYLVQYRNTPNASGWGTESSSWPEEPSSCDIGCP